MDIHGWIKKISKLKYKIKNWKNLKKQDFILMAITIIASLGLIARFILLSLDDIKAMMGTVYPGERVEKGGNFTIDNFISYFANIFFPYTNRIANTCEPSTYIYSFTGLIILIVLYLGEIKEEKSKKELISKIYHSYIKKEYSLPENTPFLIYIPFTTIFYIIMNKLT